MIFGVGVDMVPVLRMERLLKRAHSRRFLARVFSGEEIAACRATARPAQGFAARFAAKEAVSKALGTGFRQGVTPGSITVKGGDRERPVIVLKDGALRAAQARKVVRMHLSLTHTRDSACAFVVAEVEDPNPPLCRD